MLADDMQTFLPSPSITSASRLPDRLRSARALTLPEVMISLMVMTLFMLGFFTTYIQSRRITERSVMTAAATSLIYGIIEQIKELNLTNLAPCTTVDVYQAGQTTPTVVPACDAFPGSSAKAPPYIRVRLNQDQITWLQCVYNTTTTPLAPTTVPPSNSTAATLTAAGYGNPTVPDNVIGPLALSNYTNTASQPLTMHVWIWVDNVANASADLPVAWQFTVVYSYTYMDGANTRTIVDREQFVRTF